MRFIVRTCTTKYDLVGAADDKAAPKVFISHHQNMNGPITVMKSMRQPVHIWVLSNFYHTKTCYRHFKEYTFTTRFGWRRFRAFMVSLFICFPVSRLLQSGKVIPVYRDSRKIMHTMEQSVGYLCKGENILIFPDVDYTDEGSMMQDIYSGFLYLEKYYYKKTGKHVAFVPVYVSKNNKKVHFGDAVYFKDGVGFAEERKNVSESIRKYINDLAVLYGDA